MVSVALCGAPRLIVAVEVSENLAEKSLEVQFFVDVFCFSVKNCAIMPNFSFGRFDRCELEKFHVSYFLFFKYVSSLKGKRVF